MRFLEFVARKIMQALASANYKELNFLVSIYMLPCVFIRLKHPTFTQQNCQFLWQISEVVRKIMILTLSGLIQFMLIIPYVTHREPWKSTQE